MENKIKFRLPTRKEFEDLIKHSFLKWNEEKKGLEVKIKHDKILFLPACGFQARGFRDRGLTRFKDSGGWYWGATEHVNDDQIVCTFFFDESSCYTCNDCYDNHDGRSVRLVSDIPFEEGIEFNGVWWKPENEPGHFTFDEAMRQFQ